MKKFLLALSTSLIALTLAACSPAETKSSAVKDTVVKIGYFNTEQKVWDYVSQQALKQHIKLKFVTFGDTNQPNQALQAGSIDMNAYQHYYLMNVWNSANHGDLKALAKTYISPMRMYGQKGITSIKDLKKHDTIVIPNDPADEERALTVLQTVHLITLTKTKLATVSDIKSNPHDLKIVPVDPAQTARQFASAQATVTTNDVAQYAHLDPNKAIFVEPINAASAKWINILVVNGKDINNPAYKKIVAIYHTKHVINLFKKYYPTEIPAWNLSLK